MPKAEVFRYICSCCGTAYHNQTQDFYSSRSPLFEANNGRTTVCRNCVNSLYERYIKEFEDKEYAFYYICSKFGWYFNEENFKTVKLDKNVISAYLQRNNTGKSKGKTFENNILEDFEELQRQGHIIAVQSEEEDGEVVNTICVDEDALCYRQEMVQRWGDGLKNSEYLFLEEEYSRWSAVYNCGEMNMQTLVEEICQTKLTIRQKRALGQPVDKEQKQLQDLMGSGNLKPMQETGANAAEQSTFSNWVKHIEVDRPILEPEDEFKDVDGIKKYVRIWFLGHLSKIFGKQNEYSEAYEREIEKYTVEIPTYEDET